MPAQLSSQGWQRVFAVILASVFLFSIVSVYIDYLSSRYSYIGFTYHEPNDTLFILSVAAAVAPSTYLPIVCTSVKNFAEWILYYVLYIPSAVLPVLQGTLTLENQSYLLLAIVLSFLVITAPSKGLSSRASGWKTSSQLSMTSGLFWTIFFTIYIALNLYVLAIFGGSLRIAGVTDIYDQRFLATDVVGTTFVAYATNIVAGALNPFLLAIGLWQKRPLFMAAGAFGQVFIFATAALRAVFLSILFIPAFYFLLRMSKLNANGIGLAFSSIALALMIAINLIDPSENFVLSQVVSLIYMRTFCMTGVLVGIYAEFFLSNPLTYYSHVNVVGLLVPYPYQAQVGLEIGSFLIPGSTLFNANASFWATDGIAALGFVGIVIAGVLFRVFILVVDAVIPRRVLPVACAALVPTMIGVANYSLFTSLLSGGAGLLILLFYWWTRIQETEKKSPGPAINVMSLARGTP